jgi:LytR cell envelope-related transcriptional attenuator
MSTPGRGPGGQAFSSSARGAVLVFLAVVVGIIGLQILDDSGTSSSSGSVPSPTTTTFPGQLPPPHQNASDVTIKVYNASDVQNAAQQLTEKLKSFSYTMLEPANLSETQKGTVVQCREGYEGDGQVIAGYGIGGSATATAFPPNPPAGSEDADCIVILGTA